MSDTIATIIINRGATGAAGAAGATGPAGPAPSGTGYVKVTSGVLDTPSATIPYSDLTGVPSDLTAYAADPTAAILANMPDALAFAGTDPNELEGITITGITPPAVTITAQITSELNGRPFFRSESANVEALFDGYGWVIRSDVGDYYASISSAAQTPVGLTGWDIYEGSGQPSVDACVLSGGFIGQTGVGTDGQWWKWSGTEWMQTEPPITQADVEAAITDVDAFKAVLDIPRDTAVLQSPNGYSWRYYMTDDGAFNTKQITAALTAPYLAATGITYAGVEKIQDVLDALSDVGLLDDLHDAAFFKSELAASAGGVIKTLKLNNVELFGSPTLGTCGLIFDGATQAARTVFSTTIEDRTIVNLSAFAQNFQTDYTTEAYAVSLFNNYGINSKSGERLAFNASTNAAYFRTQASSDVSARDTAAPGVSRSFPPKSYLWAGSYNYTGANYDAGACAFKKEYATAVTGSGSLGDATHVSKGIYLGGIPGTFDNPATAAPSQYWTAMASAGWLMFNRVLTSAEMDQVFVALRHVFPKWRYSTAGDSIINYFLPTFLQMPEIYGSNVTVLNTAIGGTSTPSIVAGLGSSFVTPAMLASADGAPIIFDFFSLDSFSGYSAAAQYADHKLIWAYVRSQNPDAIIVARTYTMTRDVVPGDSDVNNAGALAFNDLIRADVNAGFYDILIDSHAIGEALKSDAYAHHGLDPSVTQDSVHPTPAFTRAIGLALIAALEAANITIR